MDGDNNFGGSFDLADWARGDDAGHRRIIEAAEHPLLSVERGRERGAVRIGRDRGGGVHRRKSVGVRGVARRRGDGASAVALCVYF